MTQDLLDEGVGFTGIMVIEHHALWGIYQALALAGRRIPGDISIIALADSRWPEALFPSLTAAQNPLEEMGVEAVTLLVDLLEDRSRLRSAACCNRRSSCENRPAPRPCTPGRRGPLCIDLRQEATKELRHPSVRM